VLRFRRFLALAEQRPDADLARLAADAGYADQPHLTRDCRELGGLPPLALLEDRLLGGREAATPGSDRRARAVPAPEAPGSGSGVRSVQDDDTA
jgi:hypothetical protein